MKNKSAPISSFNKGDRCILTANVMRIAAPANVTVLDIKPGASIPYLLVETDDHLTAWVGESSLQPSTES